MELMTFLGIVLVAAVSAMLAKSHSNSKRIEEIQDRLSRKAEEGNETQRK